MNNHSISPSDFSSGLFWDVDQETLDMDRHAKYVVGRVLDVGTLQDWRLLCRRYTLSGILAVARQLRSLDEKSLAFLSVVGQVPREKFRCCTTKPSTKTPWIY